MIRDVSGVGQRSVWRRVSLAILLDFASFLITLVDNDSGVGVGLGSCPTKTQKKKKIRKIATIKNPLSSLLIVLLERHCQAGFYLRHT